MAKRRAMLIAAVVATLAGAAFELLRPWPLKIVFDYVLVSKSFLPDWLTPASVEDQTWMLLCVCGMILLIAALSSFATFFRKYVVRRLGEELASDLRAMLFRHMQRLSLTFHEGSKVGDLLTRVTQDTAAVRRLMTDSSLRIATAACTLVGMLVVMLIMDWQLALVAVAIMPILGPLVMWYRRRIRDAAQSRRDSEAEISSVAQETMSGIHMVKVFGREHKQHADFESASSKSVEAGIALARLKAAYSWAVSLLSATGTCLVIWWGVRRVLEGTLLPGDLLVFAAYQRRLYAPLRNIAEQSGTIAEATVGLERVLDIMEMSPGVDDLTNARPAPPLRGRIEFDNVTHSYRPNEPVLNGVSFAIEPGQVVALVGPSGAGKSSIMSLIPRIHDPVEGRVLLDGQDIKDFQAATVRDQMSVVLQESILFQTTILENILYGCPDAGPDALESAIRASGIDRMAERLPEGLHTRVGPRGVKLSGGERQRVAIARAMLRQTPILLLDEPTTGLDAAAEQEVMAALLSLMEGKTTIMVTHNLDLVRGADVVLVVEAGRIVERGTHDSLVAASGVYANLKSAAESVAGE